MKCRSVYDTLTNLRSRYASRSPAEAVLSDLCCDSSSARSICRQMFSSPSAIPASPSPEHSLQRLFKDMFVGVQLLTGKERVFSWRIFGGGVQGNKCQKHYLELGSAEPGSSTAALASRPSICNCCCVNDSHAVPKKQVKSIRME